MQLGAYSTEYLFLSMNKKLLLPLIIISLSSCAQLSLFQDAKTIGKGKVSIGGYGSLYAGLDDNFDISPAIIPVVAGHASYGLTNKVDLQMSLSSLTSVLFSSKIQLHGNKESKGAIALNPSIEFLAFDEAETSGDYLLNLHYASIFSVHPKEDRSYFFEPKYVRRYRGLLENEDLYGITIGTIFKNRKNFDLAFGASIFNQNTNNTLILQFGFGMTYKL